MKKIIVLASMVAMFGFVVVPVAEANTCPASSLTVCITSINPNPVSAGVATVVTVTAVVTNPNFSPTSLNLIKVSSTGQSLSVLGTFNDSGVNGDAVAGDGVFSIQITVNETSDMYMRASVAIKGQLLRVLSSIETFTVQ